MKKFYIFLLACVLLLSCAMCAVVAYAYRGMLCEIEHNGASAPADIVFLYAIPFLVLIAVISVAAAVCYKKTKGENNQCQK